MTYLVRTEELISCRCGIANFFAWADILFQIILQFVIVKHGASGHEKKLVTPVANLRKGAHRLNNVEKNIISQHWLQNGLLAGCLLAFGNLFNKLVTHLLREKWTEKTEEVQILS